MVRPGLRHGLLQHSGEPQVCRPRLEQKKKYPRYFSPRAREARGNRSERTESSVVLNLSFVHSLSDAEGSQPATVHWLPVGLVLRNPPRSPAGCCATLCTRACMERPERAPSLQNHFTFAGRCCSTALGASRGEQQRGGGGHRQTRVSLLHFSRCPLNMSSPKHSEQGRC